MTQLSLLFPQSRKGDPQTSRDAAHLVAETAGRLEWLILQAHRAHPHGLCDQELVAVLLETDPGLHPPTVISARSRLKNRGLLTDSGRSVRSKRPGAHHATRKTVWVLTEGLR